MYVIRAKSKSYGRKIGGVQFVDGVAKTKNAWLASWFSGRAGFAVTVDEPEVVQQKDIHDMNISELKTVCETLGLSGYSGMKKDELLQLLEEQTKGEADGNS